MPDLIITPSSGLIEFVKEGEQSSTVYRLEMAQGAGLIINAPLTSSVGMKSPNMMDSFGNNIFSGTSTFNGPTVINGNLSVFGTTNLFSASNVYISSSQLTIEDNILTLNAFSPFLRYAGIEMIDSGSGTLSSMLWDGQGDYFFLSGSNVNGKILTGPDNQVDLSSNYVPKATAGYKLGNSLIYDNGTNVGIGTSVPTAKIDTLGVRIGRDFSLTNRATVRLDSNGTSIPSDVLFGHTAAANQDGWNGVYWSLSSRGSGEGNKFHFYRGSGNPTGASELVIMTLDPAMNVGIGTTSPTQKLEVAGYVMAGEGAYRTNIYGSNGGAWIGFGNTSSLNSLGRIGAYGALFNINSLNGDTSFQYDSAEKMRITTGGHLGLGITNPAAYVNANGNWFRPSLDGLYSSIYATTEAVVNLISSGSSDGAAVGGVYFTRARAQGDAHYQIAAIKAFQSGTSNTIAGGTLYFYTKNNNGGTAATDPAMVIGPGGNVGIGTTGPNTKLHIYGSGGGFEFGVGSPNCYIETIDRASVGKDLNTGYYTRGSGSFTWSNGSYTERMCIDGNGRVGIGTTNPVSILDVVGLNASFPATSSTTQSTGSLVRLRNGNSNLVLDIGGNGGNGNWLQSTNRSDLSANYPLLLNPNGGNVGIGTTSPSTKLHIYENANRVTYISQNNNHTARFEAYGTATAIDTTASNGIFFRISGGDIVKFAADGNVGIGTTSPSTKLHVFGNTEIGDSTDDTGLIIRHGAGSAQYGRIRFYTPSTNIHTIHSFPTVWNSGTFLNSSAGAMNLQGTNGITFGSWNNVDVAFAQGGNNYFKNNVGIGTTSPSASLHVNSTTAGVTLLRTDGTNGTLFSVVDDLSDSLMSVNNSAGLPVLEVFADDRIVAGQYNQNDFVIRNNYVGIGTNNPTSKLYVTSSTSVPSATFLGGNVGIGTSSPAAKLVVIGETQISSNAAYTTHFNYQDTGIHFISMANGGYTDFRGSSNNITTMRVKGDGSVGIGTTIPSAPLHVVGVISGSSFSGAGTGLTGTAASLTAGTATNATQLGGVSAASYVTLNDTQSLTNKTITGTFTGNLTGNASTSTIVNGTNGQLLFKDIRAIAPNNIAAGYLQFGFTTWTNTLSTSPYADYLHLRSYTDSSGGNDNLVMFRKDAIGMRIWQQTFGSASNYSTYKDVAFTDSIGNGTITIAAGTGVGVGTTNTFTTNQSGATTVTISNSGVTSNVAGTGISVSGATGAVTITNSGVTSAVAGTGVGVSAATGAVTFSIGQAVGPANTPSFAGIVSSAVTNYAFLQVTDTNNFWITPGNANWGLYFETSAGGLLGGTGDSNRLGFVGSGTARFYVDLNNGNGWFGGTLTAAGNISAANLSGTNTGDQTVGNGTITIAAGTGVGVGTTNTFTTNQSGATTVTISNNGVTAITTNTGLSTNTSATGAVTITNTGVTSNVAGTGISLSGGTGAVTITNSSPNATHTGDVTGATALTIANDAVTTAKILNANVTLAKIANITAGTILGNNNASAAAPLALTAAQVATMLSGQTMSIAGNAATATILQTARNIGGVSFNGSADINLPGVNTAGNQNTSGTATTATTANALNTSNSYTGVNFTATGYFQTTTGFLRTDDANGIEILTTTNSAQTINVKGILIGSSYDTNPPQNEIRTSNNQSLVLNARGSGQVDIYTNDSTKVTVLNGGNVGVGTSNPGRKLDVEGIVRTRGASGSGGFEIGAATTGTAKWRIEWDSASDSLDFNWVG